MNKGASDAKRKEHEDSLMVKKAAQLQAAGADDLEIEQAVRQLLPSTDGDLQAALKRARQASRVLSKYWLSTEVAEIKAIQD